MSDAFTPSIKNWGSVKISDTRITPAGFSSADAVRLKRHLVLSFSRSNSISLSRSDQQTRLVSCRVRFYHLNFRLTRRHSVAIRSTLALQRAIAVSSSSVTRSPAFSSCWRNSFGTISPDSSLGRDALTGAIGSSEPQGRLGRIYRTNGCPMTWRPLTAQGCATLWDHPFTPHFASHRFSCRKDS